MRKYSKIYIPFEDFKRMPSYESVSRCRRHFQNTEKKYLPTDPEVRKKRGMREEEWRKYFGELK